MSIISRFGITAYMSATLLSVGTMLTSFAYAQELDDVETSDEAAAFLINATFGPTHSTTDPLRNQGYSAWFREQTSLAPTYTTQRTEDIFQSLDKTPSLPDERLSSMVWFENAVTAKDQLRQRAAFALSQIFVTSTDVGFVRRKRLLQSTYKDLMVEHAFGNFRELLHDVTYHPLMGEWLTYAGNEKANPETGAQPDENYAREIMQLFSIGLVELNNDATPQLSDGEEIPTYDNDDIIELAKVFTGLYWDDYAWRRHTSEQPQDADTKPMVMHNEYHSEGSKTFLGETIPDYGDGDKTINHALDILFNHPNVGPFIGKQLIQRFTTSNPGPSYVSRVSRAFNNGTYTLPDGENVGSGTRGDMEAVFAAVLFGSQTFSYPNQLENYGKVREPIVRLAHWARVTEVIGFDLSNPLSIAGQSPYRASSVFNFYRPGYIAPNSVTAGLGLVAPELQISNGVNLINYLNAMQDYNFRVPEDAEFDTFRFQTANELVPSFARQLFWLERSGATGLVTHLNAVLTANRMSDATIQRIIDAVNSIQADENTDTETLMRRRVAVAVFLATTTVEYITQPTL